MRNCRKFYINGEWVAPAGRGAIDVIHAATEAPMAQVLAGQPEDASLAVAAASAAQAEWAATPVAERAALLQKVSDGLNARLDELAEVLAAEMGMPLGLAKGIQAGLPAANFSVFANIAKAYEFESKVGNSLVLREPAGVVVAITPWNYPLHQLAAKVAPALAAGCTVVAKPSEVAPVNAFILAEVMDAAGVPPGVFNLVTGYGAEIGEALVTAAEVDMVSFTGSTAVGKRISVLAAQTVKRVHLELGGKSANIILPDADFGKAVVKGVAGCFLNSGQTCSAPTRMLVPENMRDEVVALAKAAAEEFTVGDPMTNGGKLGPLVSAEQRSRVRKYIQKGIDEGATLVTGGSDAPEGLTQGFYVRPTVFADVSPEMVIAQEEIFGPVLCILTYRDEDEAIAIANDSPYGLSGQVWSQDENRAIAVARRIETGDLYINDGRYNLMAPFGGRKQSGVGREMGVHGFEEFLESKALHLSS